MKRSPIVFFLSASHPNCVPARAKLKWKTYFRWKWFTGTMPSRNMWRHRWPEFARYFLLLRLCVHALKIFSPLSLGQKRLNKTYFAESRKHTHKIVPFFPTRIFNPVLIKGKNLEWVVVGSEENKFSGNPQFKRRIVYECSEYRGWKMSYS